MQMVNVLDCNGTILPEKGHILHENPRYEHSHGVIKDTVVFLQCYRNTLGSSSTGSNRRGLLEYQVNLMLQVKELK